ncbi:hypothetical protein [Bradyrhizobium diazoefficiens]|uniref:hypothetical protein n=1 Tax=Bradyrhizobium diazoefficiens TaxID=1355477 RepID=UPI00272A345F|nr:hypothetical protein [Bradyrhizobium diazoefficiens]WLA63791.1 hypothetical protein QNN01_36360 [Bradyrhizobium diazoefficiens]
MKTVYIIDSNYPEDHYADRADGAVAQYILKALNIRADMRLALNREHFESAVHRALKAGCDVLHISCHGDDDGIGMTDDDPDIASRGGILWPDFVNLFQGRYDPPQALVMSACCGASSNLGRAFTRADKRPGMIIGSTDKRPHSDYVAAWALLYRRFRRKGIEKEQAQEVLEQICAAVHRNFRYLRWDEERERYLRYPGLDQRFEVVER